MMTDKKKDQTGRNQGSWSKAEDELKKTPRGQNEGEGSRSAAAAYDHSQEDFARHGDVTGEANAAKKALEGPERAELEKAERRGKSHSHGEDPALYRKGPGAGDAGERERGASQAGKRR
jgi:hypothetical protein